MQVRPSSFGFIGVDMPENLIHLPCQDAELLVFESHVQG